MGFAALNHLTTVVKVGAAEVARHHATNLTTADEARHLAAPNPILSAHGGALQRRRLRSTALRRRSFSFRLSMILSENRRPLFGIMLVSLEHDLVRKPVPTFRDHARFA
jgi:hypothetical protein